MSAVDSLKRIGSGRSQLAQHSFLSSFSPSSHSPSLILPWRIPFPLRVLGLSSSLSSRFYFVISPPIYESEILHFFAFLPPSILPNIFICFFSVTCKFSSFWSAANHNLTFWMEVAESLSRERKVSAVYSSDLKRASYTAEIIALKCGLEEITMDPNLRERHLGVLQGMSRREASKTNPAAFEAMDRGQEIPGGGESVDQLSERCTSSLQKIGMKHLGKRIAVVTHGGVIRELCKRVNTESPCGSILNKRVIVFRLYEDKWVI